MIVLIAERLIDELELHRYRILDSDCKWHFLKAKQLRKHRNKPRPPKAVPNTRVSVIVFNQEKEILLVKHRKGQRQYWVLPGGRLEYGENFFECGVREVKEETGLEVKADRIVYLSEAIAPDRSRHIVNVYLLAKLSGGTLRLGNESVLCGVEFMNPEKLRTMDLYPPVSEHILESCAGGFSDSILYLGNLWV